jgi:hypothetical protein
MNELTDKERLAVLGAKEKHKEALEKTCIVLDFLIGARSHNARKKYRMTMADMEAKIQEFRRWFVGVETMRTLLMEYATEPRAVLMYDALVNILKNESEAES